MNWILLLTSSEMLPKFIMTELSCQRYKIRHIYFLCGSDLDKPNTSYKHLDSTSRKPAGANNQPNIKPITVQSAVT